MIKQFIYSRNYDAANHNFDTYVKPYLKYFDREQILEILSGINENRQCNSHRYAEYNNSILKTVADKILGDDFKYEDEFPNVKFNEE